MTIQPCPNSSPHGPHFWRDENDRKHECRGVKKDGGTY